MSLKDQERLLQEVCAGDHKFKEQKEETWLKTKHKASTVNNSGTPIDEDTLWHHRLGHAPVFKLK